MHGEGNTGILDTASNNAEQQFARDFPIFSSLPIATLGLILPRLLPKCMSNGETLFIKDQPANFLALVISGEVHTMLYGPSGRQLVVESLGPGQIVGETTLLHYDRRMTSACAVGKTKLWILPQSHFGLLRNEPAFMQAIMQLLCRRLHHSANLLETVSLHRLESRLARFLLEQVDLASPVTANGVEILLPTNQSILAAMLNISRPKLNAQLQNWLRSGVISWQQDRLRIDDINQLKICAST